MIKLELTVKLNTTHIFFKMIYHYHFLLPLSLKCHTIHNYNQDIHNGLLFHLQFKVETPDSAESFLFIIMYVQSPIPKNKMLIICEGVNKSVIIWPRSSALKYSMKNLKSPYIIRYIGILKSNRINFVTKIKSSPRNTASYNCVGCKWIFVPKCSAGNELSGYATPMIKFVDLP